MYAWKSFDIFQKFCNRWINPSTSVVKNFTIVDSRKIYIDFINVFLNLLKQISILYNTDFGIVSYDH